MSSIAVSRVVRAPARVADVARAARPQLTVMAAQCAAGAGNLGFAVVLSRVLDPSDYGRVVAFLALYFLLHVPGAALTAAGALDPERVTSIETRIVAAAAVAGAATAVGAVPLATALDLPTAFVAILGAAMPGAAMLGIRRGLAYGREQHRLLAASLLVEPIVRVSLGTMLALAAGPTGAAAATVGAGYAAVAVCAASGRPGRAGAPPLADDLYRQPRWSTDREPTASRRATIAIGTSFVLVALLQTVDLLAANRVLDADEAARFGVLSTLGGAAVFATATVPLVLMPAAARGRPQADGTAVLLSLVVGATFAVVGLALGEPLVNAAFGSRYGDVAQLVGPYLLAMALVGVVRVRLAQRARTAAWWEVTAVAVAVIAELVAVARWADRAATVVAITLFVTAALTVVIELPHMASRPAPGVIAIGRHRVETRSLAAIAALCVGAALVRMATNRGLWVDEAISVQQARLPFAEMLRDIRVTDVHPPLHHTMLWGTVRVFGTSTFAVRLPSLVAGVALVPVLAWVGRVIYDRRTGWVAAVLATVAPFCVWYSQEARMYSLFMVVAAVAVGAQVQAIRRGRTADWVLYGAATGLLIWTQYFALLPIAVQQAAFVWLLWRDRRQPAVRRRLVRGWLIAAGIVVLVVLPLLPILRAQLEAYSQRGAGLVPGQAGASSSGLGGGISIYAVGANLIWAVLGYHADGVMVQIAALWPLLMLLAFVLLGRGRAGTSLLLLALVVVPMAALFVVGAMKRDLFELRYFAGAVPVMLLLAARLVTATTRRPIALGVVATIFTALMAVGLVDQQLNGANPRLYDFEGALGRIEQEGTAGDVVLYEPSYLAEVVEYYAPELDARPVGARVEPGRRVWVLATDRVINAEATAARLGNELAQLERSRKVVGVFQRPNVRVWELSP